MVTGPVWGPALHPEVHFCREQVPQDICTACSLCPKVFPPRCLRGSVPLYLLVVPEKGFHGEVFLAALPTLLYVHAQSRQSGLTLCDPVDGSPPGFSVHGILQARILGWVSISFSWGSSRPRDPASPCR